jgi:hypothetical protein
MAQLAENIAQYLQQTKTGTTDPFPYDRLMIYYRKQKEYKKELQLINQAIKVFTDKMKRQANLAFAAARSSTAIRRLSEKINRSSGLTDKKGNPKYVPEPLARWMKRKHTVQQRLKKTKT